MEKSNKCPLKSGHGSNSNIQLQTAIICSRSDNNSNNPYPTTFVEADICSFKQVVQMLTGSDSPKQLDPPPPPLPQRNFTIPPIKSSPKRQQQNSFKLYERRNNNYNNNNLKNSLMINTLSCEAKNKDEIILSPSMLDFPKLTLSSPTVSPLNEEERAIAEKGFYLHPSPPSDSHPPQLLSLFPLSSPH